MFPPPSRLPLSLATTLSGSLSRAVGAVFFLGLLAALLYATRPSSTAAALARVRSAPVRTFVVGLVAEVALGGALEATTDPAAPPGLWIVFLLALVALAFPGAVVGYGAIARVALDRLGLTTSLPIALLAGVLLAALLASIPVYRGALSGLLSMFGVGAMLLPYVERARTAL
ncbi:hypothetical protein MBEHAL_2328 [Halarchaeum acidiphilum MH1-52-1]|uniref:DUF8173 domain-containing protein n=1 Tax=Halarchaeum acidiphilum MH1-52-1 TaxID=1261545 RepID=U3AFK6_9EURY|nr:hypothetical protein [Halarchaeum acidiphilum]GAD53568.1 hypothetical protein MBEHAL_2328 [Halarchaeum acidiphilum MH1-52-1]